jgi:hypothetical protein
MHFIKISFLIVSAAFLFPSAKAAAAEDNPHYLALVLGPARSGTSTIARAVNACGYAFTPKVLEQQEQISKGEETARPRLNPKGTFEDGLFLKIGEQFLNRTQGNTNPLSLTHPLAKKGRINIGIFFNKIFSEDTTHIVLKHPGLSMHASVLEDRAQQEDVGAQHLNIQFLYIIALRNPVDTALSMFSAYHERSPNISVEGMLAAWQENLTAALQTTEGKRRFFIKYEDVMENTDETLSKLSTFLGTPLTEPALAAFKEEFLTESLRHGRTPFTEIPSGHSLTADQLALRDRLETLYGAQST